MKNFVFKSASLILLFAFLGCSSDSSDSSNPTCTPITCYNGGTSNAGCGCDCPLGFTGPDCSVQKTPTKILIAKIRVLSFDNLDISGNYWDNFSGQPDILLQLLNGTSPFATIYSSNTYFENTISDNSTYWDFIPTSPIEITQFSKPYILQLFDYDGADIPANSDDNMGYISFFPYTVSDGFPQSITIEDSSYKLKFQVFLSYQW